ncbi:hypothetical protein [Sodalis endosymbiont of Henestaris halophilus]
MSIIIDLRSNGRDVFIEAVSLCELFISDKSIIQVYDITNNVRAR